MQARSVSERLSFEEAFVAVPEEIVFGIVFMAVTADLSRVKEQITAARSRERGKGPEWGGHSKTRSRTG